MNNSNVLPKEITEKITETVKTTFTPTGNFEADKNRALEYAKNVGMDAANTNMAVIAATEGWDAAAKAMVDSCGGDYAAMRAQFG